MPGPVERWLETFMCQQYADTFEAYGFKTLQSVCQLQQPQLQAMGVAQEHVDKILESVHVLRQSMFGGMNHYKDESYNNQGNRMQHTGYPSQAHSMGGMNPNYMPQVGYNNQGNNNMAVHRGQFMDSMYQQHSQGQQFNNQQYNNQNQVPYNMGQYNQQNSSYGPMMNYNNNQRMQSHPTSTPSHLHSRHQNPQEVANNILQMAASYQPSQTVQVPLSKQRTAPYHVPVSSHYNMQNHVGNPEQMNRQFNYPNSSSSHNPHAARTSPVSPGSMYMHSPASQHSSQSLPNSSPRSIHSPPGYGNIKSPIATPSPASSLRSPCHMQSPVNTPINQQLHVMTGQQMVQSPPQQQMGYSPKSNPISPPVIHSPQFTHHVNHQQQVNQKSYTNELRHNGTNYTANSPLQSLQKLCMLPDRQVVDPKSIVNDPSSSSPDQNQKNGNSDADLNSMKTSTISDTASSNITTDGQIRHEKVSEPHNNPETDVSHNCSDSGSKSPEIKRVTTLIESYADDAVKKSADNTVKVEIDVEKQKLKYLGQPCNTSSNLKKDSDKNPSSQENKSEKTEEKIIENVQNKQIGDITCDNNSGHKDNLSLTSDSVVSKNDMSLNSDKNVSMERKSNDSSEKDQKLSSESEKKSSDIHVEEKAKNVKLSVENHDKHVSRKTSDNKLEKSNVISKETCTALPSPEKERGTEYTVKQIVVQRKNGLKSNIVIDSESICDKSIVNGCESLNCDDQSKSDISSDCRKDEVKSVVNGVDDSDDSCSDSEINKELTSKVEQVVMNSDQESQSSSVLDHSKTGQKSKMQTRSKRVLREIPARMASASPYYVDASDSDDDGYLLVRKDVKFTYSRYGSKSVNLNNTHVVISDDEPEISDEESLDRNSLDSDISKGYDNGLIGPVISKPESKIKSLNGSNSNISKKKGKISKTLKKKEIKMESDTLDNPGHGSGVKTDNQRVHSRAKSKRARTTTSKYGDEMYLGDDFVLDSEEEIEIEKKSKRKRKISGDPKANLKVKSEVCVIDLDGDEENESRIKKKNRPSLAVKSNVKALSEESMDDSTDPEIKFPKLRKPSGESKSNIQFKPVNEDSEVDVLNFKEISVDIMDSSDNLGDGSDIITFKTPIEQQNKSSYQPLPSTSKSRFEGKSATKKLKSQTKGKSKLTKGAKSKSRGKLLDDSIKNMKLKKTMNLMKQKGKKKDIPVKEVGPFLRVKDSGTQKEKCSVVNQQIEETSDKSAKNKKSSVLVSTVHMSKLPSERSVYLPAPLTGDSSIWMCALCQKHSSYKFLGDLFGPYYVEGNLPEDGDGPNSSDKKGKQKRQSIVSSADSKNKGRRKSRDLIKPQEVWVHEDCAAWADGVLLIGAKIYGLKEATSIASSTVCTHCKENGAMVGCLHKGCSQKFHYYCGIESGCYLDEENYSLLCPKHRDKRLKSVEAKSFKT